MKAHINADAQLRLMHIVRGTAGPVSGVNELGILLHATDKLHQAWTGPPDHRTTGSPSHRVGKRRVKRYAYPGTLSD